MENALERDPSNVGALQFLENFERKLAEQSSHAPVLEWITTQRTKHFNSLKKAGKDEHRALTALAIKSGGVKFLENKWVRTP